MKTKEFEEFVQNNAQVGIDSEAYSVIGLCGEAGEVAEWFKKTQMRTKPSKLTEEDLKNELGDVLHYAARIAIKHGWGLKDCMAANVDKLTRRYLKGLS